VTKITSQVTDPREDVQAQKTDEVAKEQKEPSDKKKKHSAVLTSDCNHQPRTISQIIHHLPMLTSRFLSFEILESLTFVRNNSDSCMFMIDDAKDLSSLLPVQLSPSLDVAIAATLFGARNSGNVSLLVLPTTACARKVNYLLQSSFGSNCRVTTTISSLSEDVPCELFADARVILSTPGALLRKLLTKDLPSFQTVVFYHPLTVQNQSLLTAYLFDALLLRLKFSCRKNKSLRTFYFCDSQIFSVEGYELLTGRSKSLNSSFSHQPEQQLSAMGFNQVASNVCQQAVLPMISLLFRRHLTRKQLFKEIRSSYLYRSFKMGSHPATDQKLSSEQLFDKQLYKTFLLLSTPSLGPFQLITKSHNRYTLTTFGEEFLGALTYSSAEITDVYKLLVFLSSSMREDSLTWEALLEYLRKSFPVENAYRYNQSFNQLIGFIQEIKRNYSLLSDRKSELDLTNKTRTKLAELLRPKQYSFGDFQNMKLLSSIGQRLDDESLNHSLQAINNQMLKSFFSQKSKRKKNVLYNKQKARELVLSEVLTADYPQTISQVALTLRLNRNLTDRILRSFTREDNPIVRTKTVTTTKGMRAFFASVTSFPAYFDCCCTDCQFYSSTGICSLFSRLGKLAPHKLPYEYHSRAYQSLKPGTVPCRFFSAKKLRRETYPLETFGDLSRVVQGLTVLGTTFKHKCLYCESIVEAFGTSHQPQIGTSTISCLNCGSLYKLGRSKGKKKAEQIIVKCQEGNLNVFETTLYNLSGLIWSDHKLELVPAHGMTIRLGEKVSFEGEFLIIENVRKRISDLEYLYSSVPLEPEILLTLEQHGVNVRFNPIVQQLGNQIELPRTSFFSAERLLALTALRETCLVNNPILNANICSRWAVTVMLFCLLEQHLDENRLASIPIIDFEWIFLDILLRARNVHHAFTSRLCEGLTGNLMWVFLKELFGKANLVMLTRVRDRLVSEKEFFPGERTLAYSAVSALINFFLLLVQDRLIMLHLQADLPWKGASGLVHGTKKVSALNKRGFFLDFIDTIKIAAILFLAKAIAAKDLTANDVKEKISPSGVILYSVKQEAIPKLEKLVNQLFNDQVYYSSQTISLEKAYSLHLHDFIQLLDSIAVSLRQITIVLDGTQHSAADWLEQWDDLSASNQELVTRVLHKQLPLVVESEKFEPFSYLPVILRKRLTSLLMFLPSLVDFELFCDWEEHVLTKNDIRSFLFKNDESNEVVDVGN